MRVILAILAFVLAGPTMHLGEVSAAHPAHHQSHEDRKALPSASAACPMVCCPCLSETLVLAPPVSVAYTLAAVAPPRLMTRSLPPLDRPPRA